MVCLSLACLSLWNCSRRHASRCLTTETAAKGLKLIHSPQHPRHTHPATLLQTMAAAPNQHPHPQNPTEQAVLNYLFTIAEWAPKIQAQVDKLERWSNRRTGDLEDRIEELEEENEHLKKEIGLLKTKLREEQRERKSATDALWGRPSVAPADSDVVA